MKIIEFTNISQLRSDIFAAGLVDYVAVKLTGREIYYDANCFSRMEQVAIDLEAAMVFSGYRLLDSDGRLEEVPSIEYQPGSFRDDFDFGGVVLLNTYDVLAALSEMNVDDVSRQCDGGWYALRLSLSIDRMIGQIPEILYTMVKTDYRHSGQKQHDYVKADNYTSQLEKYTTFIQYLERLNALTGNKKKLNYNDTSLDSDKNFPVEMSVVIPVRNRVQTIADAVHSALEQQLDSPFNIIVVDNDSDDGTREILESLEAENSRVKLIKVSKAEGLGIGGCWNRAVTSEFCGRFAVQLDSDDLYSRPDTLRLIHEKFMETGAAVVVGTYRMTDFDLNLIPPGIISHSEWNDTFGADNALRLNGFGAPRAFYTPVLRSILFPNVSYGEDYAVMLRISREYAVGRLFEPIYNCRRWNGNSDSHLPIEKVNEHNFYKDFLRSYEFLARMANRGGE